MTRRYSASEVASMLAVNPGQLERMARAGWVSAYEQDGTWWYPVETVESLAGLVELEGERLRARRAEVKRLLAEALRCVEHDPGRALRLLRGTALREGAVAALEQVVSLEQGLHGLRPRPA
jgi:hypothetical protein